MLVEIKKGQVLINSCPFFNLVICDGLLFLGIMVSHREYVNLYYIIMHGVNNSMFCIDSS